MTKKVAPTEIRLAVEWLAQNANGISLIDWEPRSQTLLNAADEIERLRGNLSLAEEGLANYALEVQRLQKDRNECLEAFHILFRIFPEPK